MCGIAGIVEWGGAPIDPNLLGRMGQALRHRGPDDEGTYLHQASPGTREASIGLAHTRLSIIDLAGGRQPLSNADQTVWVVFNGEIYNFQSLRDELRAKGYAFRTQSDTECIVHAYEEYGDDCVQHFRGMFAFALWDARAKRLLLARDRLGKKPLLYAQLGQRFIFASEFQALLQVPDVPLELDLGALGDYLAYGYVPAPASIYRAVRKLLPGHRLVWEAGQARVERYWRLEYLPKLCLSTAEALEELERRLTESVKLRLIADVPVGVLLSGGVDSSTVAALMARLSPGRVKTFSIGFDETAYDELAHARRVAERYGTDHHEVVVKPDATDVLPVLVRHYGEPYADSSAIPTYYVSKMARQWVTVSLNGDGGDELFAGYDRYRAMWLAEALHATPIPRRILPVAARAVSALTGLPSRLRNRGARFLEAAGLSRTERHARWVTMFPPEVCEDLLEPSVADAVMAQRSRAVELAFEADGTPALTDRLLATDVATYLPNDLLVKVDIASMANSLEMRSPFLDHEVVEFTARLPASLKLRHGVRQKYLLKRLARGLIPRENIDRPKKGFSVPLDAWLRGPLRTWMLDLVASPNARSWSVLDAQAVRGLVDEHLAGRRDWGQQLWTVMMLELWFRTFMQAPREASVPCSHHLPLKAVQNNR